MKPSIGVEQVYGGLYAPALRFCSNSVDNFIRLKGSDSSKGVVHVEITAGVRAGSDP